MQEMHWGCREMWHADVWTWDGHLPRWPREFDQLKQSGVERRKRCNFHLRSRTVQSRHTHDNDVTLKPSACKTMKRPLTVRLAAARPFLLKNAFVEMEFAGVLPESDVACRGDVGERKQCWGSLREHASKATPILWRRKDICVKDFGSMLSTYSRKCLQVAVVNIAPTTSLRKRWRSELLRSCANVHPSGGVKNQEAQSNLARTEQLLCSHGYNIRIVQMRSLVAWENGAVGIQMRFGAVRGRSLGWLLWCTETSHVFVLSGVPVRPECSIQDVFEAPLRAFRIPVGGMGETTQEACADACMLEPRDGSVGRLISVPPFSVAKGIEEALPLSDASPKQFHFEGDADNEIERGMLMRLQDEYVSVRTNSDGACSLHAAFGVLVNGELFCGGARVLAARALESAFTSGQIGERLRRNVLSAIWAELARPAAVHCLYGGDDPIREASRFWQLASPALKTGALEQVSRQHATERSVDHARGELRVLSRAAFVPAAVGFIDALYHTLKHQYSVITDFNDAGVDGYDTKLEAMMDPDARYDGLRLAMLLPMRDAAASIADHIYVLSQQRDDGGSFEDVAHKLLQIDAIEKTHSEDPPDTFIRDAFGTYLTAFSSEGHDYYLSPDEVTAVAEAAGCNVVVTRAEGRAYKVIDYHLAHEGPIAVLVLRGLRRGHFERLCPVEEMHNVIAVGERRRAARAATRLQAAERKARARAREENEAVKESKAPQRTEAGVVLPHNEEPCSKRVRGASMPTTSITAIRAQNGVSSSMVLELCDVEKLLETTLDVRRLLKNSHLKNCDVALLTERYPRIPSVCLRAFVSQTESSEQLHRWMGASWVKDWPGWGEMRDRVEEANGDTGLEVLAATEGVRKFARARLEDVRIEAKTDEERLAQLRSDGLRVGAGIPFATKASCADSILQLLAAQNFIPAKFGGESSDSLECRKKACADVRRYVNRQENPYFHTMAKDAHGMVVDASDAEHYSAPFDVATHAELIVRYFLKRYGPSVSMPVEGMTVELCTRFDSQRNCPQARALTFGRKGEATAAPCLLRLFAHTGERYHSDEFSPIFVDTRIQGSGSEQALGCAAASFGIPPASASQESHVDVPPPPPPRPDAAGRKRRRVREGGHSADGAVVHDEDDANVLPRTDTVIQGYYRLRCAAQSNDPRRELEDALDALANAYRSHPTLPGSLTDDGGPDPLALASNAAVVLPRKHCAFKGCREHFENDDALVDHSQNSAEHMQWLGPAAKFLALPASDAKKCFTGAAGVDRLRVASVYNEGLAVAVRRGAPLAALAIDRRCLFNYTAALDETKVSTLICWCCARKYPFVQGRRGNEIAWTKPLQGPQNDGPLDVSRFAGFSREQTEAHFGLAFFFCGSTAMVVSTVRQNASNFGPCPSNGHMRQMKAQSYAVQKIISAQAVRAWLMDAYVHAAKSRNATNARTKCQTNMGCQRCHRLRLRMT